MSGVSLENNSGRLSVKTDGKILFIPIQSIHWVQSAGNYVQFAFGQNAETLLVRQTLASVEKALDSTLFIRIHRSVIVNARLIKEMRRRYTGEYNLTLESGKQLTLSRGYKHNLLRVLQSNSASQSRHIPKLARVGILRRAVPEPAAAV